MLAPHSLELTSRTDSFEPLILAPYGIPELAAVLPLSPEITAHFTPTSKKVYEQPLPELTDALHHRGHLLDWGIYVGKVATSTFCGAIELAEGMVGNNNEVCFSTDIRHIGTLVSQPGRGIGTLAKLAVIAYAFEHTGTSVLKSMTSQQNVPAQRSLEKVGFSYQYSCNYLDFGPGIRSQFWALAPPHADYYARKSPRQQQALAAGYKRYANLRTQVDLAVTTI